jgi:hypothetical protein
MIGTGPASYHEASYRDAIFDDPFMCPIFEGLAENWNLENCDVQSLYSPCRQCTLNIAGRLNRSVSL